MVKTRSADATAHPPPAAAADAAAAGPHPPPVASGTHPQDPHPQDPQIRTSARSAGRTSATSARSARSVGRTSATSARSARSVGRTSARSAGSAHPQDPWGEHSRDPQNLQDPQDPQSPRSRRIRQDPHDPQRGTWAHPLYTAAMELVAARDAAATDTTASTQSSASAATNLVATSTNGTATSNITAVNTSGTTARQAVTREAAPTTQKSNTTSIRQASSQRTKTSSRSRRKQLLKAKDDLLAKQDERLAKEGERLAKQEERAALRITVLEESSDDDLETAASERAARVRSWVELHSNPSAIMQREHVRGEIQALPDAAKIACINELREPTRTSNERAARVRSWVELDPNPPAIMPQKEENIVRGEIQALPDAAQIARINEPQEPTRTTKEESPYSELALAISEAVRAIQPTVVVQRNTPELPVFNGMSSDWLPFKAAFEQTLSTTTEQENLARLRRSLKGLAKDAVQCLFIGITTPQEVMKLLAARFGRPNALVMTEMEKLKTLPKPGESLRDMCLFASRVTNITATVKALNQTHYLYNPEIVQIIVEKLPVAMRHRYFDYIAEQPEDEPDLIKITKFLERTADRCGMFAPAERLNERPTNSGPNQRRPARTYHVDDQRPPKTDQNSCPICKKANHGAATCNTFKEASVSERWDIACKQKLCFRCLRTWGFRHSCKMKRCGINECSHVHHQLLHNPKSPSSMKERATERTGVTVTSTRERKNQSTLLKVLKVQVSGPAGVHDTYALLDDGSTCTLIDETTADKIGVTGPGAPFTIEGVAGVKVEANRSRLVKFSISGHLGEQHDISARTIEHLELAPQAVKKDLLSDCSHLHDIVDDVTYEEGKPTILIGHDNWHLLLTEETRRGTRSQPVASRNCLGWVIHGTHHNYPSKWRTQRVHHVVIDPIEEEMEQLMREHFSLESLGVAPKKPITDGEQRALQQLEANTKRLPAGGFETCLLWKSEEPKIPASYDAALNRLHGIERKLDRNPDLKERYQRQLNVLLENDFAEKAPRKKERNWYLPHFAVINPAKPEKLRIVHDAAAKSKGISLNDLLLSGPDLLQSLPGVLIRFRQRPIAVTADIKDMFLRIQITEEDRDMQRFLWRDDRREGPPDEYRMKSVIFGATSSPCTAIYVKNRNADDLNQQYPEAAAAIVRNHYMDDFLGSFDNEEEAIKISHQVALIHSHANFFLQRWASNSRHVISDISPGKSQEQVELDPEKILGMVWHPEPDTLSFNVNEHKIPFDILTGIRTPTKRQALRTVMSLFDPLGLATPVTVQAKRIIQETWRSGIGWDDPISPEEDRIWRRWIGHVQKLPKLALPRCHPYLNEAKIAELHTYVDASTSTYAAAVYWRVEDQDGRIHINLVIAKARVAPINKVISVPRLELQAAVLGTRLARTAIEEHDLKPIRRVFWSDSRTVLAWLRTGPRTYKPFVAHRVAEISEETKTAEWRWVPTKFNVADDATRDTPDDFSSDHRWFRGPEYLYSPEEDWPQEKEAATEIEATGEERVNTVRGHTTRLSEALPDIQRFSSYLRVVRATARVLQFIERLRPKQRCAAAYKRTKKNADNDPVWQAGSAPKPRRPTERVRTNNKVPQFASIEAHYIQRAERLWILEQQEEVFTEEVVALTRGEAISTASRLKTLALIIDVDGIIRLKSRIAATQNINEEQKEPAVIDGKHRWTQLYISCVHSQLHHGGFNITTNEVRQRFWVLRLRNTVRTVIQKCQSCRIRRATPAQPSTGNHPPSRLAHHQRPFTFTGLDYFGPVNVTVGRGRQKRYGVIFTCLTTRAVHLEIAHSLTTDSAIMALRRFIGRRGCPTELWSDQGTNLRGADIEMKRTAQEALQRESSVRAIRWRFIPPSAPFMGGAWERLVRSVKSALDVTLRERAPNDEVLHTLLVEAEHTINSRPLTHVSTSPEDPEALTPNHFLLGGPSHVPLPGAFSENDVTSRRTWRVSQALANSFWSRWVKEYLPELQNRREPCAKSGVIKLGDLVLIADGTLPRNQWPRGEVISTFPGPDGEIRAVDVRTNKGVLRRPTKKLAILKTDPEP